MDELYPLCERVGHALSAAGQRLACAESCTGGWIAKLVTDVPGSSTWFDRGFVSYSNASKCAMLSVKAHTLERHGAVSEAVILEMVAGVLAHSEADIAVAVSGIAGPDGGSAQKPVGSVWLAWALRGESAQAVLHHFQGDREAVRHQAASAALQGVISRLA